MIISIMVKIFFLLAVGFTIAKAGLLKAEFKKAMSDLLVYVFLPASLFVASQEEFAWKQLVGIGQVTLITLVYYAVVMAVCFSLSLLRFRDRKKSGMFALLVAFANTGFVGISIVGEAVGGTGLIYAAIYNCVFDVIYFSIGLLLIQDYKKGSFYRTIAENPLIWIPIGSVVLYALPFRFPVVLTEAAGSLADCMLPTSILIIGAEIADMKLHDMVADKLAYMTSFLRMMLVPGITFVVCMLLPLEKDLAMTVVLLTAMPSASLNVIMGRRYEAYPEYATATVMQNTILMLLTLPVFIHLCQQYL